MNQARLCLQASEAEVDVPEVFERHHMGVCQGRGQAGRIRPRSCGRAGKAYEKAHARVKAKGGACHTNFLLAS